MIGKLIDSGKTFMKRLDDGDFSASEILLAGACVYLFGILVGMLISPRKYTTIGSYNGVTNHASCDGLLDVDVLSDEEMEDVEVTETDEEV